MAAKAPRKPRGRPQLRLADLPEHWASAILKLYKEGAADIEVIVALGISKSTFYALLEREVEFTYTVTRGREAAEAYWMKIGRENLHNRNFNGNLYALHVRNRYKYGAKDAVTTDDDEATGFEVEWVEPAKPRAPRTKKPTA